MFRMNAIKQYQNSSVHGAMASASPHQLIQMLLDGALDRIARARGAARNGERQERVRNVGAAVAIIEYLRLCLDPDGGSVTERLDALYDFCLRHLAQANASDNPEMLDDVADVLRPIKEAWESMPQKGQGQ